MARASRRAAAAISSRSGSPSVVDAPGLLGSRKERHLCLGGPPPRRELVAHERDAVARRTDEDEAGLLDLPDEGGVLREESVPGMNGLGASRPGRLEDPVEVR